MRREPTLTDLENFLHLRYQDKACANCRYLRYSKTGAITSECLLLGRTMGISGDEHDLETWAWQRLCDRWSRWPKTWRGNWVITGYNPHWKDKHVKRRTLKRIRRRIAAQIAEDRKQLTEVDVKSSAQIKKQRELEAELAEKLKGEKG